MAQNYLFVGTLRRAHHADAADSALGIYRWTQSGDGTWQGPVLTETAQPGWLAASHRAIYALNEVREFDGEPGGAISAFARDPDSGALRPLGHRRVPGNPCHAQVDATGRWLLASTFHGGTVHMFPLAEDGALEPEAVRHQHTGHSVHPRRQTSPHPHGIAIAPDNRLVLIPDLGTDRVATYTLDAAAGTLTPDRSIALPAGSGPRHACFDATGAHAYVINEMNATITVLAGRSGTGPIGPVQTCDLLPEGFAGLRSGGELALHPSGRWLYATTRSHGSSGLPAAPGIDTLVWFAVDPQDGTLRFAGRTESGGGIPRAFCFEPDGAHLLVAHQCSSTVVRFRLNPQDGTPTRTGESIATPVPVCLLYVEHGQGAG